MNKDFISEDYSNNSDEYYPETISITKVPTITVLPQRVFKNLATVSLFFGFCNCIMLFLISFVERDVLSNIFQQIFEGLNLDSEMRLPAYFASLQLAVCSGLLFIISRLEKSLSEGKANQAKYWSILSGLFLFLSIDESISIHEKFNAPIREIFNTSGVFSYPWTILYSTLVVVSFSYFYKFLCNLPSGIRTSILLAGGIYILGAVGIESIQSYYGSIASREEEYADLIYRLIIVVEEVCELLGIALFIKVLLTYVTRQFNYIAIRSAGEKC